MQYALAIGADTSQGAPGDALEYSAAAGAAAFIFGTDEARRRRSTRTYSFMTDTPDFWRREYMHYPRHGGRFTGEPAYFKHTARRGEDADGEGGHQAGRLRLRGLPPAQRQVPDARRQDAGLHRRSRCSRGWLSPWLGNTYSGASPIGLTAILDIAKPGDRILMVIYGSGVGLRRVHLDGDRPRIDEVQSPGAADPRRSSTTDKIYVDYGTYAKFRGKIRMARVRGRDDARSRSHRNRAHHGGASCGMKSLRRIWTEAALGAVDDAGVDTVDAITSAA